jgi:hypothetical protein
MAKYTFHCDKCGASKQRFTSASVKEVACDCGGLMSRQMPNIAIQRVTEVVDSYTGVTRDQDHDDLTKNRRDDHYWTVEVPRLIETCSIETSLENGWLVYNERGELVINKPPSKR